MSSTPDPTLTHATDGPALAPDIVVNRPAEPASGPAPKVEAAFRASATSGRSGRRGGSFGTRLMRGVIGVLLAACIIVAGALWQTSAETARQIASQWLPAPVVALVGSLAVPLQDLHGASNEVVQAPAKVAAAAAPAPPAPVQPASTSTQALPRMPVEEAAPAAVGAGPDQMQLLQAMARDIAALGQELEQIKASIATLKVTQEQMSRDLVRAPEPPRQRVLPVPAAVMPPPPSLRKPPPAVRPARSAAVASPPVGAAYVPPPRSPVDPQVVAPPPPPPPGSAPLDIAPRPPLPVR